MKRVEIIAKVIRENHTPRGLDVGIGTLAELIDNAIAIEIEHYGDARYNEGYEAGLEDGDIG